MTKHKGAQTSSREEDFMSLSATANNDTSSIPTTSVSNTSTFDISPSFKKSCENDKNHENMNQNFNSSHPSLVPKGITLGLAIFSFILSIAGYVFRLIFGEPWQEVLKHATFLVPVFVIGFPLLFWLSALILNKFNGMHIQRRNAFSLGWLLSCVTMLWLMGTYS